MPTAPPPPTPLEALLNTVGAVILIHTDTCNGMDSMAKRGLTVEIIRASNPSTDAQEAGVRFTSRADEGLDELVAYVPRMEVVEFSSALTDLIGFLSKPPASGLPFEVKLQANDRLSISGRYRAGTSEATLSIRSCAPELQRRTSFDLSLEDLVQLNSAITAITDELTMDDPGTSRTGMVPVPDGVFRGVFQGSFDEVKPDDAP